MMRVGYDLMAQKSGWRVFTLWWIHAYDKYAHSVL
jgi:hypothetical protein